MVEAKLYAVDEESSSETIELDKRVFGAEVNVDLIHRAVRTQLLHKRQGTSSTKTRSEARGGGRKPWRQKGTGRARAGTIRSPLWVGGGTVFGPKPRSYNVSLPKKMRRGALVSVLSDRAAEGKIAVVDRLEFESPKTKVAVGLLRRLEVDGSALVVAGRNECTHSVRKSFSNLVAVKCISVDGLTVYDVLRHDELVISQTALAELEERF